MSKCNQLPRPTIIIPPFPDLVPPPPRTRVRFMHATLLQWKLQFSFISILLNLFHTCLADLGTSAHYSPPYSPTLCYGNDPTQFPSSNLFGAAGSGIWDNGASCGRQYLVKCISGNIPNACNIAGDTIQIRIVDYALQETISNPSSLGTSMVLSDEAFNTIANISASIINIEFQQV